MALAGLLLVLLARLTPLGLPPALALACATAMGVAGLRQHHRSRGERVRDRRINASIEAALARCRQLAGQADRVGSNALVRFRDPSHLEALGLVQLCCERLRALPERIEQRRPLLQAGGGVLLSAESLADRLSQEEEALKAERSATIRRERNRLVDQLRRNLEAARLGMDERDARLLALSTRLESIDGGLRQLQNQVERHWPSSEAGEAAVGEAVEGLDETLDQIEQLLEHGRT